MSIDLQPFLEDLEQRLDPVAEEALLAAWRQFNAGNFGGDVFTPRRPQASPSSLDWPTVTVNAALEDYEQMALQQLGAVHAQRAFGQQGRFQGLGHLKGNLAGLACTGQGKGSGHGLILRSVCLLMILILNHVSIVCASAL